VTISSSTRRHILLFNMLRRILGRYYLTHGNISAARDNAIPVSSPLPTTCSGPLVGPWKALGTDLYFIIATEFLRTPEPRLSIQTLSRALAVLMATSLAIWSLLRVRPLTNMAQGRRRSCVPLGLQLARARPMNRPHGPFMLDRREEVGVSLQGLKHSLFLFSTGVWNPSLKRSRPHGRGGRGLLAPATRTGLHGYSRSLSTDPTLGRAYFSMRSFCNSFQLGNKPCGRYTGC
jgi:hypothetical protein